MCEPFDYPCNSQPEKFILWTVPIGFTTRIHFHKNIFAYVEKLKVIKKKFLPLMKSKMKKSLCIGAVTGIQVILSLLSFLEFIPCLGFDGVPSINIWFLKLTWWIKSELNRHVPCGTKTGEKINYFFYLFISFLHPVVGVSIEYSLLSLIFLNRLTFTLYLILFSICTGKHNDNSLHCWGYSA